MKKVMMFTAVLVMAGLARAQIPPIEGGNVVGFIPVAAAADVNSIITVPFEACMGEGAGKLADMVSTNGLTSHASDPDGADQLVVLTLDSEDQVYYYYWYKTGDGWTPITTDKLMPDGSEVAKNPPAASAFSVSRGLGFWIKRKASENATVYLKGQVTEAAQSTAIAPGLNLVGYGAVEAFALNGSGVNWTGAYGDTVTGNTANSDKILVSNGSGGYTEYFFFKKPTGWPSAYDALDGKWITKNYAVADVTVPAGKGFWYLRRGAGSFNFQPDAE